MLELIKQGLGVLVALLVAFFVLRPMMRGLLRPQLPMSSVALPGPMPTVSVMVDDDMDERSPAPRINAPALLAYEQKIGLAKRMASENPKQVAQVVKSWVGDDGG